MPDSSHVGRRYSAPGQVIDGERAARFAASIAGSDPVGEPGAIPPTYAAVYLMFPALGQVFGDADIGINLAGLIHGEQGFTFHQPVAAGDVVDSEATISSVDVKRGMTFVGVDMESKRQGDGTPVCSGHALLIIRG
jgi:acyl dehydratase